MSVDSGAGKTVAILRAVNGKLTVDMPDDPRESGGPTRFTDTLDPEQARALMGVLSPRARDRALVLVSEHMHDLEQQQETLKAEAARGATRRNSAIELRAAVDLARADVRDE